MNSSPFNHSHFLGYINLVNPSFVKVHFPSSVLMKTFTFNGEYLKGGLVGNYVVIEGETNGFLGKIQELSLPEKERLELSEKSFNTKDFHPVGKVEILLSFDLYNPSKIDKGINSFPLIGSRVFICSSEFIAKYFKSFGVKLEHHAMAPVINIGHLIYDQSVPIELSFQALFSRHCAVIGTTGGGKSYTISKFIEGVISSKAKAIIIDATGEYQTFDKLHEVTSSVIIKNSYFPYQNLTINDLFVLFRPAGQVQQPILLEAIKSLKIAGCLLNDISGNKHNINGSVHSFTFKGLDVKIENGLIVKQGNHTAPFNNAYFKYKSTVEDYSINQFDITILPKQIANECYQIFNDKWGAQRDERNFGNSTSLIMRVHNVVSDNDYSGMFGFESTTKDNLIDIIESFIKDPNKNVLRIGFEDVPYNFQVREILANALGRYLLNKSRTRIFEQSPLILFVDEAHQFLNKKVKDEYFESTELSAFDNIAKESRKYGLFLCLSTQMPRDIPIGTLSQMGTFVAHRLINHQDKEAVASACSSANKETLSFLPTLGAGEAIIMGVEFPMPVMLQVSMPNTKPKYDTPLFKLSN